MKKSKKLIAASLMSLALVSCTKKYDPSSNEPIDVYGPPLAGDEDSEEEQEEIHEEIPDEETEEQRTE